MNYAEVLLNNIASLALIPIVIAIVLKLKNAEIGYLKQQNETLREETKMLGLFRVSEVEKEFKALKEFYETQRKEAGRAKHELDKAAKELENVRAMTKKEAELIVRLFKRAIHYAAVSPGGMPSTKVFSIAEPLYMMEGPIGELWREHWDGGKLWRAIKEYKRKKKGAESNSST